MHFHSDRFVLAPTDLGNLLGCRHLASLDLAAAHGEHPTGLHRRCAIPLDGRGLGRSQPGRSAVAAAIAPFCGVPTPFLTSGSPHLPVGPHAGPAPSPRSLP